MAAKVRWNAVAAPSLTAPQPLTDPVAILQSAPPWLVGKIPVHGARQPLVEGDRWPPAELVADPARIDGIAPVVARPVIDEGDQPVVRCARSATVVEDRADLGHNVYIARLVAAADVVRPARPAIRADQQQRLGVILDVKPVADVFAPSVTGIG